VSAHLGNSLSAKALLEEKPMVTIRVKGGTPCGSESLCPTCSHGHVIKGFRATEEEVFCRFFYVEREIRFAVRECTFYEDKRLASKAEMEDIAWFLTTRKPGRAVGFVSAAQFRAEQKAGSSSTSDSLTRKQE